MSFLEKDQKNMIVKYNRYSEDIVLGIRIIIDSQVKAISVNEEPHYY